METTYDITEVCTRLGTTSRPLRYYEEQGLIESTTDYPSRRRRYTEAQVDAIRQVLALRTLGLSVAAIRELHSSRRGAGALLGIDGGSRGSVCRKRVPLPRLVVVPLSLCACEVRVNWFGEHAYVPWYLVVVPVLLIFVIAHVCMICRTYRCPKCGRRGFCPKDE